MQPMPGVGVVEVLPEPESKQMPQPSASEKGSAKKDEGMIEIRKALLIEDSRDTVEQLQRYFEEWGIETRSCTRGKEACGIAREFQPDVVFLDIQLPDMEGWDVAKEFREDFRLSSVPIIIISVVDDVESAREVGAVDYLMKPLSREPLKKALQKLKIRSKVHPQSNLPSVSKGTSILLVDDQEVNLKAFTGFLEKKGYDIVIAKDGFEAIQRARAHKPDLILMDVQMPGMDGLEATRQLRTEKDFSHTPIIALTALAMSGDRERCLEAGATDYLSKPVSLKELHRVIQERLKRN
jgi:CheY-like chemotaxis protein